jgi:hypothetical protein
VFILIFDAEAQRYQIDIDFESLGRGETQAGLRCAPAFKTHQQRKSQKANDHETVTGEPAVHNKPGSVSACRFLGANSDAINFDLQKNLRANS